MSDSEKPKPKFPSPQDLPTEPPPLAEGERPAFLDPERASEIGYISGYAGGPTESPNFTEWDESAEPLPDHGAVRLKARHKEVARLHALGKTNNEICKLTGYSQTRVSILIHTPAVMREVDRYRNRLYEQDLVASIKELGYDSIPVIEEMLRNPNEKLKDRAELAKWILEKNTGRAKQEVSLESNTLGAFLETLKQMQQSGDSIEAIDVTPESGEESPVQLPESKYDKLAEDLYEDS